MAEKTKKEKNTQEMTSKGPTKQMRRRTAVVLALVVVLCFAAVTGQLVKLQITDAEGLRQLATEQQLSDTVVSANRGAIYDAGMNVLAESQMVWTIIMSPSTIQKEETRVLIADELSVLLEIDRDSLYKKTTKTGSQYEVIKKKINHAQVKTFSDWVEEHDLSGVFRVITDYKRVYPYNSLASCVLGFTGTDGYGLYGLEAQYEDVLAGTAGRIVTARNGWGDELPTTLQYEKTVDAEDGDGLVLTIDQTVQHYVEKYLDEAVKKNKCSRGCAILMDVDTGAILAMATKNDYNLNDPFKLNNPTVEALIAEMAGDKQAEARVKALQEQWNNMPVTYYYEPGSVFKAFTTSMALEEGVVSPLSHFNCSGSYTVAGVRMRCHIYPRSHGNQSLAEAISHSCNPSFFQIGQLIGSKLFYKYYVGFGFTELTKVDMLGEAKVTPSLYHTLDNLGPVELTTSSIGQTFKVTPIQMITAMSAVANGGRLMQPYVVSQVLDAEGNVVKNTTPTVKRQVISEETSKTVAKLLEGVVDGGGGKNAYVAGYHLAGKTGTAEKTEQRGEDGSVPVTASFCAFAPANDPKYAILVILDEPGGDYRTGGTIAAPVAASIMADVLPYMGVEPQYTEKELAEMNRVTPDVVNKEVAVARNTLQNKGLTVKVLGDGVTVIKQNPAAGAAIPSGGQVVLYTEEEEKPTTVKVPDFSGKTVSQVNSLAVKNGLNVQLVGLSSDSSSATSSTQSIAAGTLVAPGTVIKVTFIYPSVE